MKLPSGDLYLDGIWVSREDKAPSFNPFDGTHLADISQAKASDVEHAIASAYSSYQVWSKQSVYQRARVLWEIAERIALKRDYLVNVMILETGKPLADAMAEVETSIYNFRWFAQMISSQNDEIIPSHDGRRQIVHHAAIGVVAVISPWNFPLNLITRKIAPALAAGNSVIIKPSEAASLVAAALLEVIHPGTLEIPQGLISLLHGDAAMISDTIMQSQTVRKISFTGSTRVGKLLFEKCASTLKRMSLELGGNAPFIVTGAADLEQASTDLVLAKTRNNGQICVAPNRVIVQRDIHDAFMEKVIQKAKQVSGGNPLDASKRYGPLINEAAVRRINGLLEDARSKGARIVYQERLDFSCRNMFPLTIVDGIHSSMNIYYEEIFGPVIASYCVDTIEACIEEANHTEYGLAAYLYTRDPQEITRISAALETGLVGINTTVVSTVETPFGGVKNSGIGLENGKYGLREFQNVTLFSESM